MQYWARSLMDRISGFGPLDRGSIPLGLVDFLFVTIRINF